MASSAITGTTATTAGESTRHIFPFFDLPRELRDAVYDESFEEKSCWIQSGLKVIASNATNTKLLTISRQFQQEYQERASAQMTLHLKDNDGFRCQIGRSNLPAVATTARRLHCVFICYDTCFIAEDCHHGYVYIGWVKHTLAQLSSLRSVSIQIVVHRNDFENARKTRDRLIEGGWPDLPKLADLRVYVADDDIWDFEEDDGELVVKLSKETGDLVTVNGGESNATESKE